MTQHIALFLLIIFSVHLLIFLRLTFKHKRSQFLLAAIAFLALVVSNALRLWRPQLDLAGHNPHIWLRFVAWIATMGSVALSIRNKVKYNCHRRASYPPRMD
jgi:4-amino-4-deoxy-L-arabinose transferase-like glycosyltransferase